jgi:hypothetical protein
MAKVKDPKQIMKGVTITKSISPVKREKSVTLTKGGKRKRIKAKV